MRLKEIREKQFLTQAELGKLIGVEQNTISQWEQDVRMPRADKLPLIAKVLNCTVDDLFEDTL